MTDILPIPTSCLGFTGTRGMITQQQYDGLKKHVLLLQQRIPDLFAVHGDCVGGDAYFDAICLSAGIPRGIFPSDIWDLRAKCNALTPPARVLHAPAPPLVRNRWIPLACARVIALPKAMEEQKRSGTCHCIRQSRALNRSILTIWPDGSERFEGGAW